MVSREASTQKVADVKYYGWAVYTLTVSTNDTFTAQDFVATANLSKAVLISNSDGSELTCTALNNVVTVTQAAIADRECTLFVFGVRA